VSCKHYGNLYFVREEGEDQSILQSLESIKTCLRQGGCRVVPGLPRAVLTLITSVVGGLICGFAAQPAARTNFCLAMGLIFSPWSILFIAACASSLDFGMASLVRNIAGFLIGVLVCLPVSSP